MQRIIDEIHLGETVTPVDSIGNSRIVNKTASDFNNAHEKVQKIEKLINKGDYDVDNAR